MKKLACAIIIILAVGVGGVFQQAYTFLKKAPGDQATEIIFKVEKGDSLGVISQGLEAAGVISNKIYFKVLARLRSQAARLKVGEYLLHQGMLPTQVLDVIVEGKSVQYKLTIPEGTNMYEIADLLKTRGFLKAATNFLNLCKDPQLIKELLGESYSSLEGYLFPETYSFERAVTARTVISNMVENYKQAMKEVGPGTVDLSAREQVILASIIEKETGAPEERSMISSVFHNRLRKKMKLQSDPTIIYGMAVKTGVIPTNIRKKDILNPTPYNTYTVKALPIGPITNPGKEALQAAVRPVKSDKLFFVSRNDGTHVFTTNYKDHQKAVKDFQLNRKARVGKSWRDRIKRKKNNR